MNRSLLPLVTIALAAVTMAACASDHTTTAAPAVSSSSSHVLTISNATSQGGGRGVAITVADESGQPVDLTSGKTRVDVQTRTAGGAWQAASAVVVDVSSPPLIDVVVVADDSGSEAAHIAQMRDAISQFSHVIGARAQDDRVGLVRVSTAASVLTELSADEASVQRAAQQLAPGNGWTALWDGIRIANDVLDRDAITRSSGGRACASGALRSIVVFTDGRDNNSADQHDTSVPGDGIDTTFADLLHLKAGGQATSVDVVGIGTKIDEAALRSLASETGGAYRQIDDYLGLVGALHGAAAKLNAAVPVCFQPASCTDDQARIVVTLPHDAGSSVESIVALPKDASCRGS